MKVQELLVPMRDGVKLFAKLFRPDNAIAPLPVVMMRNPYNSGIGPPIWDGLCETLAQQGYAVINQDVRGTCRSEGKFRPFIQEGPDGYDAVEWAATQPWCNGKVGLWGLSYLGACALQAAAQRPPHLVAVAAHYTACDYFDHWVYDNGIFNSLFIEEWADGFANEAPWRETRGIVGDTSIAMGARPPFYAEWLAHPHYDEYWAALDLAHRCRNIAVPMLLKGGWFDVFANGTISTFRHLLEGARTSVRSETRLQMAPACHGPWNSTTLHFPLAPSAMPDMDPAWWDRWLKGAALTGELSASVRLYVTSPPLHGSADEGFWIAPGTYPLLGSKLVRFALASEGRANGAGGNGQLLREGVCSGPPDQFTHDPAKPVPTLGGALCTLDPNIPLGVVDQASLGMREDILIYKTEPLTTDLALIGPVKVVFWARSSAATTQFSAKLTVSRPDGTVLNFLDRMVRSTLREGSHGPAQPSAANATYRYELELGDIALLVSPGMRLQLEIASSNYPRFAAGTVYDRQLSNLAAHEQIVYHDETHPSRLEVTTIPATALRSMLQ